MIPVFIYFAAVAGNHGNTTYYLIISKLTVKLWLFCDVCSPSYISKCMRVDVFLTCSILLRLSNTRIFVNNPYFMLSFGKVICT